MRTKATKNDKSGRNPLWCKEYFKERLADCTTSIVELTKAHAADPSKWQGLYNDVLRWRKEDPELDQTIRDRIKLRNGTNGEGGRPKKDANLKDMDWQDKFCRELVKHNGNRELAAAVTPYAPDSIYRMLNEGYSEYDKEFSDKVHIYEMRLGSRAEQAVWDALDMSIKNQDAKNMAWIGLGILKVRERKRWGDEVRVRADVTHAHTWTIKRENLINELVSDQQRYFEKNTALLESGQRDVVDAELINE